MKNTEKAGGLLAAVEVCQGLYSECLIIQFFNINNNNLYILAFILHFFGIAYM